LRVRETLIEPSNAVVWLSLLIALLALVANSVGLFSSRMEAAPSPSRRSLRQSVEMYVRGLYRHDTLFVGTGNRRTTASVLLFPAPTS
jgi:hypothetical protein